MAKKSAGKVGKIEASAVSMAAPAALTLQEVLQQMGQEYRADPQLAVRSQHFIKHLHKYIGTQLEARLTAFARKRGIEVQYEAKVLGSTKPKNVDVAVVDPENGPFVLIGVRSQMSSIGNNVLTYYEGIVGECISLQDRYPMSTHGYVYLHPLTSIKEGHEAKNIDHGRYARMYAAVTGRQGPDYKNQRGIFDQFAYLVVDFETNPPTLHDEIVLRKVKKWTWPSAHSLTALLLLLTSGRFFGTSSSRWKRPKRKQTNRLRNQCPAYRAEVRQWVRVAAPCRISSTSSSVKPNCF